MYVQVTFKANVDGKNRYKYIINNISYVQCWFRKEMEHLTWKLNVAASFLFLWVKEKGQWTAEDLRNLQGWGCWCGLETWSVNGAENKTKQIEQIKLLQLDLDHITS